MRRFSVYRHVGSKSKYNELEFLQQSPVLSQIKTTASSFTPPPPSSSSSRTKSSSQEHPKVFNFTSTDEGIKFLTRAVGRKKYDEIESIFSTLPALARRPIAMRLLVKAYCDQNDFVSARAILNASLDKVGDVGVQRYIAHLTFSARNPAWIEDAFNRLCSFHQANKTVISPEVVAAALYGLLFLDCRPAFDRVWRKTALQFWEPSLKSVTLLARALDYILQENWEPARKMWGIAAGMNNFNPKDALRFWFVSLRYFLVESPSVEAVDRITGIMTDCDAFVGPKFTTMILRHLSSTYYSAGPLDWLRYANDRGYMMDSASVEVVVHNFGRRFSPKFARELDTRANQRLASLNLLNKHRHALGEGERHNNFWKILNDDPSLKPHQLDVKPQVVLGELRAMAKRGLCLPYSFYTAAFQKICGRSDFDPQDLAGLIEMFKQRDFSVHSAATDLAVLDQHCKIVYRNQGSSASSREMCRKLIGEYLVQYPLVSLDLCKRTTLASMALDSGHDPELALDLVDSLRLEQCTDSGQLDSSQLDSQVDQSLSDSGGAQVSPGLGPSPSSHSGFSASNHDSASLQVMVRSKMLLDQPLTPFIRTLTSEDNGIYFDEKFRRLVAKLLHKHGEEPDVLIEIDRANERLRRSALVMVDEAVQFFATTVANAENIDGNTAESTAESTAETNDVN